MCWKSLRCGFSSEKFVGGCKVRPRLYFHRYKTVYSHLLHRPPFILGSLNSISVKYDVRNLGEPAYLPQIRISLDNNIASFARIPSSCKLTDTNERELMCDLTKGNPINRDQQQTLIISIDTTKLEGNDFSISATVFSSGEESSEADNKITDYIPLDEFSHVEITGYIT